jgi:hypothetical protein
MSKPIEGGVVTHKFQKGNLIRAAARWGNWFEPGDAFDVVGRSSCGRYVEIKHPTLGVGGFLDGQFELVKTAAQRTSKRTELETLIENVRAARQAETRAEKAVHDASEALQQARSLTVYASLALEKHIAKLTAAYA